MAENKEKRNWDGTRLGFLMVWVCSANAITLGYDSSMMVSEIRDASCAITLPYFLHTFADPCMVVEWTTNPPRLLGLLSVDHGYDSLERCHCLCWLRLEHPVCRSSV